MTKLLFFIEGKVNWKKLGNIITIDSTHNVSKLNAYNPSVASTLYHMGNVELLHNNLDQSLDNLTKCCHISNKALGYKHSKLADTHQLLGLVNEKMGLFVC